MENSDQYYDVYEEDVDKNDDYIRSTIQPFCNFRMHQAKPIYTIYCFLTCTLFHVSYWVSATSHWVDPVLAVLKNNFSIQNRHDLKLCGIELCFCPFCNEQMIMEMLHGCFYLTQNDSYEEPFTDKEIFLNHVIKCWLQW